MLVIWSAKHQPGTSRSREKEKEGSDLKMRAGLAVGEGQQELQKVACVGSSSGIHL